MVETGYVFESASFPTFCFLGAVPAIPFIVEIILTASSPRRKKNVKLFKIIF